MGENKPETLNEITGPIGDHQLNMSKDGKIGELFYNNNLLCDSSHDKLLYVKEVNGNLKPQNNVDEDRGFKHTIVNNNEDGLETAETFFKNNYILCDKTYLKGEYYNNITKQYYYPDNTQTTPNSIVIDIVDVFSAARPLTGFNNIIDSATVHTPYGFINIDKNKEIVTKNDAPNLKDIIEKIKKKLKNLNPKQLLSRKDDKNKEIKPPYNVQQDFKQFAPYSAYFNSDLLLADYFDYKGEDNAMKKSKYAANRFWQTLLVHISNEFEKSNKDDPNYQYCNEDHFNAAIDILKKIEFTEIEIPKKGKGKEFPSSLYATVGDKKLIFNLSKSTCAKVLIGVTDNDTKSKTTKEVVTSIRFLEAVKQPGDDINTHNINIMLARILKYSGDTSHLHMIRCINEAYKKNDEKEHKLLTFNLYLSERPLGIRSSILKNSHDDYKKKLNIILDSVDMYNSNLNVSDLDDYKNIDNVCYVIPRNDIHADYISAYETYEKLIKLIEGTVNTKFPTELNEDDETKETTLDELNKAIKQIKNSNEYKKKQTENIQQKVVDINYEKISKITDDLKLNQPQETKRTSSRFSSLFYKIKSKFIRIYYKKKIRSTEVEKKCKDFCNIINDIDSYINELENLQRAGGVEFTLDGIKPVLTTAANKRNEIIKIMIEKYNSGNNTVESIYNNIKQFVRLNQPKIEKENIDEQKKLIKKHIPKAIEILYEFNLNTRHAYYQYKSLVIVMQYLCDNDNEIVQEQTTNQNVELVQEQTGGTMPLPAPPKTQQAPPKTQQASPKTQRTDPRPPPPPTPKEEIGNNIEYLFEEHIIKNSTGNEESQLQQICKEHLKQLTIKFSSSSNFDRFDIFIWYNYLQAFSYIYNKELYKEIKRSFFYNETKNKKENSINELNNLDYFGYGFYKNNFLIIDEYLSEEDEISDDIDDILEIVNFINNRIYSFIEYHNYITDKNIYTNDPTGGNKKSKRKTKKYTRNKDKTYTRKMKGSASEQQNDNETIKTRISDLNEIMKKELIPSSPTDLNLKNDIIFDSYCLLIKYLLSVQVNANKEIEHETNLDAFKLIQMHHDAPIPNVIYDKYNP